MKKLLLILSIILIVANNLEAQNFYDSIEIQTKVWNKDENKIVTYSDWKTVKSITIHSLKDFKPNKKNSLDEYGGDTSMLFTATGFFYPTQYNGRWWLVDPKGAVFMNVAVNGVRLGKSINNEKAFNENFTNTSNWIESTKNILDESGFNSTGSWSDVETIIAYNTNHTKPIVYTTQLSLLGSFTQKNKKKLNNKEYPELANVFNPLFKNYCVEKSVGLKKYAEDKNLLGHFSDNELPFQENLITAFLSINDSADNAYQTVLQWISDNHIETQNISKEQKEKFAGFVANQYFQIIKEALQTNDPKHLYLGCRLHSSAKNNPYVLAAAEQYNDIISINFYGAWAVTEKNKQQWLQLKKPFIITEFYTKAEDTKMGNTSGAGWIVKTQKERGMHYQNFCLSLLQINNCVGWHWFRYQDNDPSDTTADPSNNNSNKGIVDTYYNVYSELTKSMQQININVYQLIHYFDSKK